MADKQHIFRAASNPVSAPTETGHHWVNTVTGRQFFSIGIASVSDWEIVPVVEDTIVNGVTNKVPSQNAVFDALATKENVGVAATEAANAIATHVSNPDPHPLYATDADLVAQAAAQTAALTAGLALKADNARLINTPATSGLSGGGDLSADRNLALNITGLTAQTERISINDEVALYDASLAAHRKMSLIDFLAQRNSTQDHINSASDDFIQGSLGGLIAVGSGTGNSTQAGLYGMNSVERALGISQSDTGTTAAGRRALASDVSQLTTSLARLRFAGRIALEALSDGVDTFTATIGFINQTGLGDHSAGAYFRYTHSVNGGMWEAVTAGGGGSPVRTAVDTNVLADVLYSIFEVEINEDGTEATFFINGALVATINTNIPPLSATPNTTFGYGWKIEKTVGTNQRNISADWYYFEQQRSLAR